MSNKTKILLVCSAGMSTSLLMTSMEKAADAQGIDAEIQALPSESANKFLAKEKVDVLLLGPQVRYLKKKFEKRLENTDTALSVIDMQAYGKVDGAKVLETALQLKKDNE